MERKLTRRQLAKSALAGLVSVSIPVVAQAQEVPSAPTSTAVLNDIESQLAKPLSPDTMKLLDESVKSLKRSMTERKKTKIKDSTEPCFIFEGPTRNQVNP